MSKTSYPECEECQAWCCKYQMVVFAKKKDPVNWQHWNDRSVDQYELPDGRTAFVINQRCPQLNRNNRCKIYKDRSLVCKKFPNQYVAEWEPYCKLIQKLKNAPSRGYRLLSRRD